MLLNLKNSIGWSTKRKIIVFSVDDYGNIRMANQKARENLQKAGLNVNGNRFDLYDSLEDADDLIQLFDSLSCVKDKNGRNAVFTAYAVPANIDFERMIKEGFAEFRYESLPVTLSKLPGYENVFSIWKEGITKRLITPQFHGREHLNVKVLMEALKNKDNEVLACFENQSYGALSLKQSPKVAYTAAFDFFDYSEITELHKVASDGLNLFEEVFGYRATSFNAPGTRAHSSLEKVLAEGGIKYVDTDTIKKEHQGKGKYNQQYNYTGKHNCYSQIYLIRNCVFEPLPGDTTLDWVDYCMAQLDICFKWNKPANISSHRVNFSGHIEPKVRDYGLSQLRKLLQKIEAKWPDVEFMNSSELGDLIVNT
jgi:hypothetical protein